MTSEAVFPLEVFVGQDFYVPAFRLMIRGEEAPVQDHDILSVTYQDSLTEIDSFDMTVMNWDPESRYQPPGKVTKANAQDMIESAKKLVGVLL